jgi:hypothetical protein
MSDRHDDANEDARRARDAVAGLPRPRPEAGYRARLKREFARGTITGPAGRPAGGEDPAFPGASRPRVGPRGAPWWRTRPWVTVLVPAAVALVVVALGALNRGPAWEVLDAPGDGLAVVDGRPIPLGHREDLGRALRGGARVVLTSGGALEIVAPGQMVVQLTPSSDVTLPSPVGRWFKGKAHAEVRSGEMRITTGRAFHGARLSVETPEAAVMVTGTTLAVIREPHGTCVCVMEGAVEVGPRGQAMASVAAGRRRFVFRDGRAPEQDEMRPVERVKLGMFRDQHRERMEKTSR